MEYITGSCTDIGSMREKNQDSFSILQAQSGRGKVCMIIICDGMGGLSKGELASATLTQAFVCWFEEKFPELLNYASLKQIEEIWYRELSFWNERLKKYGEEQQILTGTTFSGILFIEEQYLWGHVGDCRIYRLQGNVIEQITQDHTAAAKALENGTMTFEEAKYSKLNHKLTQCIGASKNLKPQFGSGIAKKGESFLLCTDGFYHRLSEKEMLELPKMRNRTEKQLKDFCEQKVRTAISRGEKDNISVIVLKCE